MIPTIGRTVIVHGISSNGVVDHPAIITRVWSTGRDTKDGPIAVNLQVFVDCAPMQVRTSVMLFETAEQAYASCAGNPFAVAAHWPERA